MMCVVYVPPKILTQKKDNTILMCNIYTIYEVSTSLVIKDFESISQNTWMLSLSLILYKIKKIIHIMVTTIERDLRWKELSQLIILLFDSRLSYKLDDIIKL